MAHPLVLAGGAALGIGAYKGNELASSWMNNSARESLNKNIGETNLKRQKKYDLWTMEQDKAYERWYQNYLYDIQNTKYYDLARKYGENTASWAVEGLKKAGLNPILAAIDGNLSSSLGNASPQSSGHSTGGGSISSSAPSASVGSPLKLSMLQDLHNSARQGDLLDAQAKETAAKTRLANVQAENAGKTEGLSGAFGAIANVLDNVGLKQPLKRLANQGAQWLERKMGLDTNPSSAKGFSNADIDTFGDSIGKGLPPSLSDNKSDGLTEKQRAIRKAHERNRQRELDEFRATGKYPSPFRW